MGEAIPAEPLDGSPGPAKTPGVAAVPLRAAFHYEDIARLLDVPPSTP